MTNLLTTKQIAELYFKGSEATARKFLHRALPRLRCEPRREGPRLYDQERVEAELNSRVGQGYRSDLPRPQDSRERT